MTKSHKKKHIYFCVTNDLLFDRRMNRICTSLYQYGFEVTLVGRKTSDSLPLLQNDYKEKRLFCFFRKKIFFYFEYNLRLFFYLLFQKKDAVCAIDLDTILPVLLVSKINNIPRIYDAHELFTSSELQGKEHMFELFAKIWKCEQSPNSSIHDEVELHKREASPSQQNKQAENKWSYQTQSSDSSSHTASEQREHVKWIELMRQAKTRSARQVCNWAQHEHAGWWATEAVVTSPEQLRSEPR